MEQIKNLKELISDLSVVYTGLRDKTIQVSEAKEIANIAGKMIKATAVQLSYNELMKNGNKIPFCEEATKD